MRITHTHTHTDEERQRQRETKATPLEGSFKTLTLDCYHMEETSSTDLPSHLETGSARESKGSFLIFRQRTPNR